MAGLYVDDDLTAYTGSSRPEYERLLRDIEAGQVKAVVAWDPDRLYRRMTDLEGLVDVLERHPIEVVPSTPATSTCRPPTAGSRLVSQARLRAMNPNTKQSGFGPSTRNSRSGAAGQAGRVPTDTARSGMEPLRSYPRKPRSCGSWPYECSRASRCIPFAGIWTPGVSRQPEGRAGDLRPSRRCCGRRSSLASVDGTETGRSEPRGSR